jgi:glucose/arabinose dehydrogenase
MMKKASLGVAVALALTAAAVTLAAASPARSPASPAAAVHSEVIHLEARQTQAAFLALGTPGNPVGNQFVSADDLFREGRKVGHDGSVCQVVASLGAAGLRVQCVATLSLPDGQITAQGLPTLTESGSAPFALAITGGTGAYRTADGQIQVTQVSETRSRYVLTILR